MADTETEQIEILLKQSGAISSVMITDANEKDRAKKGYIWHLSEFTSTALNFKFDFENPEYISNGPEPDVIQFTFQRTSAYLQPEDSSFEPCPDGYNPSFKLPPQSSRAISEKQLKDMGNSG